MQPCEAVLPLPCFFSFVANKTIFVKQFSTSSFVSQGRKMGNGEAAAAAAEKKEGGMEIVIKNARAMEWNGIAKAAWV